MQVCSGIDLIEIKRFNEIPSAIVERFYQRVFTEEEREYIDGRADRAGGIFAAKEAVVKVLGCGIGPVSWQEIGIGYGEEGNPMVNLTDNAKRIAREQGITCWSVSITHTREYAAAVAVALGEEPDTGKK